jgi:hypothetical protein
LSKLYASSRQATGISKEFGVFRKMAGKKHMQI